MIDENYNAPQKTGQGNKVDDKVYLNSKEEKQDDRREADA